MSRNQIAILKKLLTVTYFVTVIFGFWPYNVGRNDNHSRYNSFKFIYSLVLPCVVTYTYFSYAIFMLTSPITTQAVFHSKIMGIITAFHVALTIFCYLVLYVRQHKKFRTRQSIYLKFARVMELLKILSVGKVDLRPYFVIFLIRTVVLEACSYSAMWFNLSNSANILTLHPFLPIFLYAPTLTIRFYENLFYGVVLLLHIVFRQINEKILMIIRRGGEISQKNSMVNYCQLCDQLDRLLDLHTELGETTAVFNSMFNVHIGLYIVVEMCGIILRFFFQYIDIVYLLDSSKDYGNIIAKNILNFGFLMLSWIELILLSTACGSLSNEVNIFG